MKRKLGSILFLTFLLGGKVALAVPALTSEDIAQGKRWTDFFILDGDKNEALRLFEPSEIVREAGSYIVTKASLNTRNTLKQNLKEKTILFTTRTFKAPVLEDDGFSGEFPDLDLHETPQTVRVQIGIWEPLLHEEYQQLKALEIDIDLTSESVDQLGKRKWDLISADNKESQSQYGPSKTIRVRPEHLKRLRDLPFVSAVRSFPEENYKESDFNHDYKGYAFGISFRTTLTETDDFFDWLKKHGAKILSQSESSVHFTLPELDHSLIELIRSRFEVSIMEPIPNYPNMQVQ